MVTGSSAPSETSQINKKPLKNAQIQKTTSSTVNGVPASRLRKLCHSLALDSVYLLGQEIRGNSVIEGKKIAILHDFGAACYVSLLHIIPMVASITLVVFSFRGYYIGGELSGPKGQDDLKFLGLQFAAKMLELSTIASLSSIIFALIRRRLLVGDLPFGAMAAGFEFSKVSLLWSKEFVATCGARFQSCRAKVLVVSTIVVFTVLGATLGPSAAVASLPSLRNWPAGGTNFYLNTTFADLYPLNLNKSNRYLLAEELLSHWPSYWPQADDYNFSQVMPENTLISGRHVLRNLAIRFNGPFVFRPILSAATVPLATIADAVSKLTNYWTIANRGRCARGGQGFCFYNDIFYSIDAMQPVTFALCHPNEVNFTLQFSKIDQDVQNLPLVNFENNTFNSQERFRNVTVNGTIPNLSWVDLPEAEFGRSSIGAIVSLPATKTSSTPDQVLACTIDARWANATASGSFLKGPRVVSGFPVDWFTTGRHQLNSNGELAWPQVKITPEWAKQLDTVVEEQGMSVFAMLSKSVARLNDILTVPFFTNAVESVLVVMLSDGMSRTSSLANIQGSLKGFEQDEWADEILPSNQVFGNGGSAFDYSNTDSDQFAKFQMLVKVNGYGYGISIASFLSCLVLLVYSFIALVYVVHSTFISMNTSSTWESISEMLALAINSTPTSTLRNTGAGISTLRTLNQLVKVGVNDGNLEIAFQEGNGSASSVRKSLGRVEHSKFYG